MSLRSRIQKIRTQRRRRAANAKRWEVQVAAERLQLGSDYGGYAVCPRGLSPATCVYSFGVGEDIRFERALVDRFGMQVDLFDPTPRSLEWLDAQPLGDRLIFHPWGLASFDGMARFRPPRNPAHISHRLVPESECSGDLIELRVFRLSTLLQRLSHDRLDVLKMDIEGAEYEVIADLLASPIRPTQILLEFHHHLRGVTLEQTEASVARLNRAGYRIFAVSESGRELSFLRT